MPPRSAEKDTAGDGLEAVLVVFDAFNWTTLNPDTKAREYNSAARGSIVRVTPEEAARAKALGAVVDPPEDHEDAAAVAAHVAANTAPTPGSMTDEQLRGMTTEELVAYVNQNPAELGRVVALEQTRETVTRDGEPVGGGPRPEVMALADAQAGQEAAAQRAQADEERRRAAAEGQGAGQ